MKSLGTRSLGVVRPDVTMEEGDPGRQGECRREAGERADIRIPTLSLWGGAIAGVAPDEDRLPFSADVAEAPPPGGAGLASPDLPSPWVTQPCIQSQRGPRVMGGSISRELAGLYQDLRRGPEGQAGRVQAVSSGKPGFPELRLPGLRSSLCVEGVSGTYPLALAPPLQKGDVRPSARSSEIASLYFPLFCCRYLKPRGGGAPPVPVEDLPAVWCPRA